ncbi:MAG: arginase, partial [Phycisphaerales bacterium]
LEDIQYGPIWREGIAMLPIPRAIAALSRKARAAAEPVIAAGGAKPGNASHAKAVAAVHAASERVHGYVAREAERILDRGDRLGVRAVSGRRTTRLDHRLR